MTDFQQELIVSLVDSLLVGGLILLAGFGLNLLFEKQRTKYAFDQELAKLRVQKVGEIWSALYEQEALQNEMHQKVTKVKLIQSEREEPDQYGYSADELQEQVRELATESTGNRRSIGELLERNRFWIGDEAYSRYKDHHQLLIDATKTFLDLWNAPDDDATLKAANQYQHLQEELRESREDVLSLMRAALHQGGRHKFTRSPAQQATESLRSESGGDQTRSGKPLDRC